VPAALVFSAIQQRGLPITSTVDAERRRTDLARLTEARTE
jgi:hypothetical protein